MSWYKREDMRSEAKATVLAFKGEGLSEKETRRYLRRIRQAYIRDMWSAEEFFYFHYDQLSRKGRRAFVTNVEKDWFCSEVNDKRVFDLFYSKGETYTHFAPYYRREVCPLVSKEDDLTEMKSFISRHRDIIIKPLRSSMGQDVKVIRNVDMDAILSIMDDYPLGIIAEELIQQHPLMASPHPQSVNTVRITTFIVDGKVNIVRPFMRFGCGDRVVDNGAQGGLIGSIDYETGIITNVVDEYGKKYVLHPDTKVPLVGFRVPKWEEAVAFAKELAGVLPYCRYVGWDLAFTEDGWVMVEGNSRGQFVGFQLPTGVGFREELLSIAPSCLTFKKMKHK